jgi:hypothetical protein
LGNLLGDLLTALLEIGQGTRHAVDLHFLTYHIRKELEPKKETMNPHTSVWRTRFWARTYQSLVYSRECCPGALPTAQSDGLMRRLIVADSC